MSYARARLWTGITGVGFMVVLSATALWLKLPFRLMPGGQGLLADSMVFLVLALAYAVLVLPLDLVGGYLLPQKYGFSSVKLSTFMMRWHRGVIVQTVIFVGSASAILWTGQRYGALGAALAYGGAMFGLVVFQAQLAALVGSQRLRPGKDAGFDDESVQVVDSNDRAFMGGIVGLPGRERVLVPSHWLESLGQKGVLTQIKRRAAIVRRGWNFQGMTLAALWNLTGFCLATFMAGASVATPAGLITLFLWLNLWTFVGLLILPRTSRRGTMAGDQEALRKGVPQDLLAENIRQIDRFQEDEPERSAGLESVFHPMPSVERRIRAFEKNWETTWAPWNVARLALFMTWAGMGMLARCVHCNAGKPEVWVLLPCD